MLLRFINQLVYTCIIAGAPPRLGNKSHPPVHTEDPHCMVPYLEWMLLGAADISFESLNPWVNEACLMNLGWLPPK